MWPFKRRHLPGTLAMYQPHTFASVYDEACRDLGHLQVQYDRALVAQEEGVDWNLLRDKVQTAHVAALRAWDAQNAG
jgi:hypothetical protein